ncbi:MAG: LysR family transcriptional regulator [Myxococcota bacterium]|jgi:molybdate transport system regulatory protein|nr:LysR family transcriptional regulator [Myxococcota bacterium]
MKVCLKIWLESEDGEPIIGDGRLLILRAIERTGSMSAAARELGMSYRSLWGKVRTLERRLGVPLVQGSVGGATHGGAHLTSEAREVVAAYDRFTAAAHAVVSSLGETLLLEISRH